MNATTFVDIVGSVGFPIAVAIALGVFIYIIYKNMVADNKANMAQVQARCKEREDKLYQELALNREVNRKAIDTIAHYAEKLDVIQKDISDIKTDITIIMAQKEN